MSLDARAWVVDIGVPRLKLVCGGSQLELAADYLLRLQR
jgi:hypothetical protein